MKMENEIQEKCSNKKLILKTEQNTKNEINLSQILNSNENKNMF